jgi:hypothetical protein
MNKAIVVAIVCSCISHYPGELLSQPDDEEASSEFAADAVLKERFVASMMMLKDLNEKILALDHHFTSLRAQHEVTNLSNPLEYPEFSLMQEYVAEDLKEKQVIKVPDFLQQNAIFSSTWTLVSLIISDKSSTEKSTALESISCLMNFTMRLQNDLNLIYYEMDFLREANGQLGDKCSQLFKEHGDLIGYSIPLQECRDNDDWENVFVNISATFEGLEAQEGYEALVDKLSRERNNLRFSIDQTIQFVQEYASVIAQGVNHYGKFEKILSRYETEELCSGILPPEFNQLREEIHLTLAKFENAYRMPELFGSRMKTLMYGKE